MKTLLLTITLSVAAVAFTACQTETNTNTRTNTMVIQNSNSMSNMNMNGMNMNGNMSNMSNMSMMKSDPNAASQPFDLQFIDTMTAHHKSATEMAKMAVEKTQNAELKAFAQKIISDQTREIGQLKDWREKWFAGKPAAMNMELPGMMSSMREMPQSMKKLETTSGKEFDLAFLDAMIPHHASAVEMAKDALTKAEKPEIKTFAGNVIKAQEEEIKKMQAWKTAWSKDK